MKKLWAIILALMVTTPAFAANQWRQGNNTDPLQGTTLINDIDTASKNYAFDPLDRLLTGYRQGQVLTYASASTLSVTAGEIVVTDVSGSTKLMLRNAAATTVTWANIDTGSEATGTTYYVYAAAASSSATTVTYYVSASSTAPTGVTYYKRLGSFYNNASGDIDQYSVTNDNLIGNTTGVYDSGWFSINAGTTYTKTHNLNTQNVLIKVYYATDGSGSNMQEADVHITNDNTVRGIQVTDITTTALTLRTGNGVGGAQTVLYNINSGLNERGAGYARIFVIAIQ